MSKVLVIGGAGFTGSYLVDKLVEMGNEVVVVDSLEEQVHTKKADYLNPKAQYLFVKKLIVASSMSIYGEGAYECEKCGIIYPSLRMDAQLKQREWEMIYM
jgi:nucleoside-diphosphate-sugar epimerase